MSTAPVSTSVPTPSAYPEGFDHKEWDWFGTYARMIEWSLGAILLVLLILLGLPFYCIIAIPVLAGCVVANLRVSEELVCLIGDWKKRWSGHFIRTVVVPRIYGTLGFLVFFMFPVILTSAVNSRIDMVVSKRIALIETNLNAARDIVNNATAEMHLTQLSSCQTMADGGDFHGDCNAYVLRLEQNRTRFLLANVKSSAYQRYEPAYRSMLQIQQDLEEVQRRVLPGPGILQIIFDLLPACLDSMPKTSWWPLSGMFLSLSLLMAVFELFDRYGPWIQHRYPVFRATWAASIVFLMIGLVLLYLSTQAIVWPDLFKTVDLKYGLDTYNDAMKRLEELQSSRGFLDYYLSRVISVVTCVGAFVTIVIGTYITGKSSTAMYLVGFFLFFFVAEVQYACLEVALKHFSSLLPYVLLSSSLLFAYDRYYNTTR